MIRLLTVLSIVVTAAGCANIPQSKPLSRTERVRYESKVGGVLAEQFEKRISFKKDKDIEAFLREVTERLCANSEELKSATLRLFIIDNVNSDSRGVWKNYGLPGDRIYLSSGLLKNLNYENEIAAVIAMQLAHLERRDVLERVKLNEDPSQPLATSQDTVTLANLPKRIEFSGSESIFAFPSEAVLKTVAVAVELLYQGGYDPRGLASIWGIYKKNIDHSPYDPKLLAKLSERTYRAIAVHSPLLNPVVRSNEFILIQNRIQNL